MQESSRNPSDSEAIFNKTLVTEYINKGLCRNPSDSEAIFNSTPCKPTADGVLQGHFLEPSGTFPQNGIFGRNSPRKIHVTTCFHCPTATYRFRFKRD